MVSLKRYTSISPLFGLFTVITAANVWTGVNAQEDGTDEETSEEDPTETTTDDGQWTETATSTEYSESTTTSYFDSTTTTIDEFTTTETDSFTTPSPTVTTDPIPTSDIFSTTDAIPTITEDFSSTVPTPTSLPSSSISTTPSPTVNIESASTNVGAIAGGVVGGVAGVALIGAIAFLLIRRKKARSAADREVFRPEDDEEEYARPIQQSESSWRDSEAGSYPPISGTAPPPPRHSYVAGNQQMY